MSATVFVHIWDDNCNVYGDPAALSDALAESSELHADELKKVVAAAVEFPGSPVYVDGGMSVVRYMTIQHSNDNPEVSA